MQVTSDKKAERPGRNLALDFIRGIAIFLVVLGHNIQFGSGSTYYNEQSFFTNPLFMFIYSFHMPIFALLSGYLFYFSLSRRSTKQLLQKLVLSLLVPILSWKVLEYAAKIVVHGLRGEAVLPILRSAAGDTLTSMWFLWAMFFCSLLVLFMERAVKGHLAIYLILFLVCFFVPSEWNLDLYAFLAPCFVLGFFANKYNILKKAEAWDRAVQKRLILVGTICFIILLLFYNEDSYIYTTHISVLESDDVLKQIGIDLYRWIIGVVGSVVVSIYCAFIYRRFHDTWFCKEIVRLGQITIGIYILNSYTSPALLKLAGSISPHILIWILETVASIILYRMIIAVIQKVPFANKLLLGGR